MTIEVAGNQYEINKPTLRIERKVRRAYSQFIELVGSEKDEDFDAAVKLWSEIVGLVFVNPDGVLGADNLTIGEMGDVLISFFASASEMKQKSG